jgi:tRNA pseudouridine55 synthase
MTTYRPASHRPPPRPEFSPLDGILLVDKPAGPTSHDIVDRIRRHLKLPKVGHGGTLDPQATGLLIMLLGRGTRLADSFIGSDKVYEGTLRLGISTDSHDADGKITREADCTAITVEQVEAEMKKLTGDIMQTPPMVSAVKVAGVPLYKHARKWNTVERKARLIHVYEHRMVRFHPPCVDFLIRCTKGTYVRALCADVGDALGCGAHLQSLRRLQSGTYRIQDALTVDKVLALTPEEVVSHIIPFQKLLIEKLVRG